MMKAFGFFLTALAASVACGETYTWTGLVDNEWTNRFNWVMSNGENPPASDTGCYPGYGSETTVVFDPGAGEVLEITNSLSGFPYNTAFRRLDVLSGTVKIASGNFVLSPATESVTSVVYVAEGARLDMAACLGGDSSGSPAAALVKDGGGEWIQRRQLGYTGKSGNLPVASLEIKSGILTRTPSGGAYGGNVDKVVVRDGASLVWTSYATMSGIDLHIDKGGTVIPGSDGKDTTLDGISGEGKILAGTNPQLLYMTLKKRDYVFAGDCRAKGVSVKLASQTGDRTFTIASSNAFAMIGSSGVSPKGGQFLFAPGIRDFYIGRLNGAVKVDSTTEYPLLSSPLDLTDTEGRAVRLHVAEYLDGAGMKLVNGEAVLTKAGVNGLLTFSDMKVSGADSDWMNTYDKWRTCPRPAGVYVNWQSASGAIAVSNSVMKLGSNSGSTKIGRLSVTDGVVEIPCPFDCASGYESGTCILDNAAIRFDYGATQYSFVFPSGLDDASGKVKYPWTVRVGARGARFEVSLNGPYRSSKYRGLNFGMSLLPAEGVASDGGVTFRTPNTVSLYRGIGLNGPVRIEHCRANVMSNAFADAGGVLGNGSFVLRNAHLHLPGSDVACETRVAGGGTLRFEGSSRITLRDGTAEPAMTLTVGPDASSVPVLERGEAGVLFLGDDDLDVQGFDGENGRVIVAGTGTVATYADGRVKLPVFAGYSGGSSGTPYYFGFLKYDAEKGFTDFTAYATGVAGGSDSVVKVDRSVGESTVNVSARTSQRVSALLLHGSHASVNVTIGEGAVLAVGNGTDPACVLMNNFATYDAARICGPGTLDFGSSEGVIAVGRAAGSGRNPPYIDAVIKGSSVTYAGLFGLSAVWITLGNDNDYDGVTCITGVSVCPGADGAFGSGPVKVLGGDGSGAQISFTSCVTLANDMEVSGTGMNFFTDSISDFNGGALWFHADSTLRGNVEVVGRARFSTRACPDNGNALLAPSGKGTFEGIVSGGAVQIGPGEAPVVFAAENTYTGGTEIVQGTLVLKTAASAGTGAVALEGGTLRFENASSAVFTNDISGAGTVALAGDAPVTFTGDLSGGGARTLDLAGTVQTFTMMPPFAKVTNSVPQVAAMRLAEDLGTVEWGGLSLEPADTIELEIGRGTVLDLAGATVTVRRLTASSSQIVNGKIEETNPRRGLILILR